VSSTVIVPQQLRNYTGGKISVPVRGDTIDAAMADLDRQYPGIRFRVIDEQGQIRQHLRIFVNGDRSRNIGQTLARGSEVHIFGALSGG
jgi:molybdopterin converting factor small subunit